MSVRTVDIVVGAVLWGAAQQTPAPDLELATVLAAYALGRALGHADSRLTRVLAAAVVLWVLALPSGGPDPGPICVLGVIVTWRLRHQAAEPATLRPRSSPGENEAGDPNHFPDRGEPGDSSQAVGDGTDARGSGSPASGLRDALRRHRSDWPAIRRRPT